ncbi:DUF6708 domain-containing protein [Pseudomonas sp. NPDC089996]|uniref:DUF6708 domain-containing protein n=1 Tax=Pseudomonas sp. NPDC089996 TaxID=3364474 RepID=UPI0037F371C5
MAACLTGGITEAPSTHSEPTQPAPGTSEALWLKWLQKPDSPPYRALMLRDGPLMAALLPSFSANELTNWNDSEKLYNALSKLIASDDIGFKMRDSVKQAITELQGSVNAASQRLQTLLDPGIQQAVRHLNSASQRVYNGVHLIELQVQMKLGEYYALQSAHLRELQNSASEKLANALRGAWIVLGVVISMMTLHFTIGYFSHFPLKLNSAGLEEFFWYIFFHACIFCFLTPYIRTDLGFPKNEPIRFNRQRRKVYFYQYRFNLLNPFGKKNWGVIPVAYDWDDLTLEAYRIYAPGYGGLKEEVKISICKPGTNEVIDRVFFTDDIEEGEQYWAIVRLFMQRPRSNSRFPPSLQ